MTPNHSVAVVGCGYWGRNLVRNFAGLGALAAVVDPSTETAERLSQEYGVAAHSFDEVLRDTSIAAIATASPAVLHREIAIQALEAGKHVFVEKPIALSLEDGREMRDVARRVGKTLMIGHLLQYHPAYLKLKELVAGGTIGRLRYLYSNRLSMGKLRSEEDVVWSFGPHDVSMILGIAGERPAEIVSHPAVLISDALADSAHIHLRFPSGLAAHVFVSWLSPLKEQRFVAVGETGLSYSTIRGHGLKNSRSPVTRSKRAGPRQRRDRENCPR